MSGLSVGVLNMLVIEFFHCLFTSQWSMIEWKLEVAGSRGCVPGAVCVICCAGGLRKNEFCMTKLFSSANSKSRSLFSLVSSDMELTSWLDHRQSPRTVLSRSVCGLCSFALKSPAQMTRYLFENVFPHASATAS